MNMLNNLEKLKNGIPRIDILYQAILEMAACSELCRTYTCTHNPELQQFITIKKNKYERKQNGRTFYEAWCSCN